jgi:hypothetical protein
MLFRSASVSIGRRADGRWLAAKKAFHMATSRAMTCRLALLLLTCLAWPAFSTPTQADASAKPTVRVIVDGKPPITLDSASLAAMPRATVTASAHHEPPSQWQGVALEDVLLRAGVPSGETLRGRAMTTVVRVTAPDNYQVVFSLAELDRMLGNEQVILADTQDGHPLTKDGPFRLIVPGDKRPARWIHNLTTIEVTSVAAPTP